MEESQSRTEPKPLELVRWYRSGARVHMDRQQWYVIVNEGEERNVAYVPFGDRVIKGKNEFHTCTSEANLIAAAPEMLAALRYVQEHVYESDIVDHAIATAEGREVEP